MSRFNPSTLTRLTALYTKLEDNVYLVKFNSLPAEEHNFERSAHPGAWGSVINCRCCLLQSETWRRAMNWHNNTKREIERLGGTVRPANFIKASDA